MAFIDVLSAVLDLFGIVVDVIALEIVRLVTVKGSTQMGKLEEQGEDLL